MAWIIQLILLIELLEENNSMLYDFVYYGILFAYIIIGIVGLLVGHSRINLNGFNDSELKLAKVESKKGMIVFLF